MLTPTLAAVKFDLPSTPEQQACSRKIEQGLKTFWDLVERMQYAADQHQPIHQVEETLFRELLVIGRWLLRAFLLRFTLGWLIRYHEGRGCSRGGDP
jgi:hypothetical protein